MNYPVWQLGFPGGLLIAAVAVLHVFISHFAIGGGAYLVLTERRAYSHNDLDLLGYVRHHSKFFALLTVVLGAVTGVGIWFTIGLVSPEATSSLIHTFVWGWAIEWVFFFVEIAAALIYAYHWDTLDRQTHLIVGWIYFVAAWASLVVINGIITYMLTPGRWLETGNFWDGFFNPTYWPSLCIRTAMAVALAGIFGLVTAMWEPFALRERVVRWAGWWLVLGIASLLPLSRWYFHDFPSYSRAYFSGMYRSPSCPAGSGRFCRRGTGTCAGVCASPAEDDEPSGRGRAAGCRDWRHGRRRIFARVQPLSLRHQQLHLCQRHQGRADRGYRCEWCRQDFAVGRRHRCRPTAGRHAYGRALFAMECGSCHSVAGYRGMRKFARGWDVKLGSAICCTCL